MDELEGVKLHPEPISVSPYSRATAHIEMVRVNDTGEIIARSSATGFHWEQDGFLYLFTNWHVVTGINPQTGTNIGSFYPNGIRVRHFCEATADSDQKSSLHYMAANEYSFDLDPDDPIEGWLCHPRGKEVDVVALRISWETETDFAPVCLNLTEIDLDFGAEVGEEVFIVGYPEGKSFERRLPLWKRGTIATDISLNQAGQPQYYVDTLGNSGLSGSPVLHKKELSLIGDCSGRIKRRYSFAGIYAGRLGEAGLGSQVGRVFKPQTIYEVLDQGKSTISF